MRKICPYCHTLILDDSERKCPICGARLSDLEADNRPEVRSPLSIAIALVLAIGAVVLLFMRL